MKTVTKKSSHASSGFTLIELMVTIAILAVIVSIAAPSISTQLANSRVKSTTATLVNALKEARAESLIRRQEVEVTIDDDDYEIEVELDDTDSTIVASYSYSAESIIDGDDDITFKPNKTADEETLTICDTNTAASPRQITVSKLGQVSTASGGTCS